MYRVAQKVSLLKQLDDIALLTSHLRATGCHLPYVITRCYLPPVTSEHTRLNPSQPGWYSINLLRRDERLS